MRTQFPLHAHQREMLAAPPATFSCSGGSAGAWDIDDDDRFDDDRSHAARQNRRVLPADIPGKAAQSWLSCRPWFSLCRERRFHTDASHPECMPAVAHRYPGRLHHRGKKQGHRQTRQAHKPTGKYSCSYLLRTVILPCNSRPFLVQATVKQVIFVRWIAHAFKNPF